MEKNNFLEDVIASVFSLELLELYRTVLTIIKRGELFQCI
jgi:hypothetical protein